MNRLATIVAAVITAVWAASFIIDAVVHDYDPPPTVGAIMLIVAGALFGGNLLAKKGGNGKNGS